MESCAYNFLSDWDFLLVNDKTDKKNISVMIGCSLQQIIAYAQIKKKKKENKFVRSLIWKLISVTE